ncbi:outer membrane porin, OprD family [compost metagenome]
MYDVEHWSQINDFLERDQRSEFLRYDLNFPPYGVPDLLSTRHIKAAEADPATSPARAKSGCATSTSSMWCKTGR